MKKKIFPLIVLVAVFGIVIFAGNTAAKIIRLKGLSDRITALAGARGIVAYPPPPAILELTENEINDGLSLLCQADYLIALAEKMKIKTLPIKSDFCQYFDNFKIKISSGEFSIQGQLLKPALGQLEARGSISLVGARNVRIDLTEAKLSGRVIESTALMGMKKLANQESNAFLDKFEYLSIENLELQSGKTIISGIFSTDELFCNLGIQNYCAPLLK